MTERGLVDSTQWAVLMPLVLTLLLGLVQLGVWLNARTVVGNAASAVADLRALGPDHANTAQATGERIAAAGGLTEVEIRISERSGVVEVQVSGVAPLFFDIGQGRVASTTWLPQEAP